jgi:L-ribulose-5-phosphate 3-epimerase
MKSARLRMAEGATLDERCDLLRDCGFDGVDAVTPSELDVPDLKRAAAGAGIAIANVLAGRSLQWTLADPDPAVRAFGRQGLEQSLRDAAFLGASSAMVPSLLPAGVEPADARERTAKELRCVLPLAEELGVRIAIENCWNGFLRSAEELASFVDSFDSPWVVVYFDVGNVAPLGEPQDWIPILDSRIHKVDLKDFDRGRARRIGIDHGEELELGEGDCDWDAVAKAFRQCGFSGWMTAELTGSGRDLLMRASTAMDRMFQ